LDRDSQFLRWGLPGSIYCMVILSYWSVHSSFSIELFIGEDAISAWLIAAVAGLSIPIGFVIYQIYFVFRWWRKDDLDLIKQTLSGLDKSIINSQRFDLDGDRLAILTPKYQARKWPLIESYWYKQTVINHNVVHPELIITRYQHLINTFHALGATMAAIIIGHVSSIIIFFIFLDSKLLWGKILLKGIIIVIIWILIWWFFHVNRTYVRYNSIVFQNQMLFGLQKDANEKYLKNQYIKRGDCCD